MASMIGDRKQNRPARERALIAAATSLFSARGFDATTTRQIAAAAGCAEGLIHRYFGGKSGLLLAIIQCRVAQEITDLSERLPLALDISGEIQQLVEFEIGRMWEDREFFRVLVPRAMLDPSAGEVLSRIGPMKRAKAIRDRLIRFEECRALPQNEIDALAHSVGVIGFMFGFMRPVVLGHDREQARQTALTVARMLARGLTDIPQPTNAKPSRSSRGAAHILFS